MAIDLSQRSSDVICPNDKEAMKHEVAKPTPEEDLLADLPKDRGWAWVCLAGSFVVNFLVLGGCIKSFSVLYHEFRNAYDATYSATGWIVSISGCLMLLLAPGTSALTNKFGIRPVVICGGLILSIGFVVSAFATSITFLYFSYGGVVGVGAALSFTPAMVVVGQYFEKKRTLANGIAFSGSGFGMFAMSPLVTALLARLGRQGALLSMGAIMLLVCVCGALFRPASYYSRRKKRMSGLNTNGTAMLKDTNGIMQENGDVTPGKCTHSEKSNNLCERTSYDEINENDENDVTPPNGEPGTRPLTPSTISIVKPVAADDKPADKTVVTTLPEVAYLSTKTDRTNGSVVAAGQPSEQPEPAWKILTNSIVLKYAIAVSLAHTGYGNIFTMLPSHANDCGVSKWHVTLLLSLIGAADIVAAVVTGVFSNANFVRRADLFLAAITLNGALFFLSPLLSDFVRLALFAVTIAFTAVAFIVLVPVLLAEELGVARLPMGFGITNMAVGLVFLFTPVVLGSLRDATGSWTASFLLCGSINAAVAVVLFYLRCRGWKDVHTEDRPRSS